MVELATIVCSTGGSMDKSSSVQQDVKNTTLKSNANTTGFKIFIRFNFFIDICFKSITKITYKLLFVLASVLKTTT